MATTDSEIVELVINAKNLSSDELNQAAKDVEGLGSAARKAETDLAKLKVKSDTIDSYEQVKVSVKELRKELATAEVSYENLDKATRKNKTATDEQRASVKLAKKDLTDLRNVLKDQEREYATLSKSIRSYGASVKDTKTKQEELNVQIVDAKAKVGSLTTEYKEQAAALKTKVAAEEQSLASVKEQIAVQKKLAIEEAKAAAAAEKLALEEAQVAAESQRVAAAIVKYEKALEQLNAEKKAGTTSSAAYIRGEAKLRSELKLTEGQVKTSRQAIQADSVVKGNSSKSTDLLTTATRRLAQAYTVLLAAQKATDAIVTSVKGYGDLEAAITKVQKTTGIARVEVEGLADQLLDMATNVTPTATNELLNYAQVAGQLGTKSTADIMSLVSAADALGNSTNLAGSEAVELLARVLTMTGEGIPAIHNLSSSVVALGNDFAVSEQDIVHMTKEIVSGTREINLSSAAAAGFGTALKELGQPAERSRTAIQRLSGAIKEASLVGGDDLLRLSDITGMTADEIEKNLGDRPEAVIVAFLEGLDGISKSGGIASDALRKMGIDGTEATGVLTVLAGGTERLKKALELSNAEYIKGDAHIKEAIKAYADQNASIGRLGNKFTELKSKIGEAFSDETNDLVRKLGEVLDDTNGDVVALMEYLPLLADGIVDVTNALNDVITGFGEFGEGIGFIKSTIEIMTLGVNTITVAFKGMYIGIVELTHGVLELYNKFAIFDKLKISTDFLDSFKNSINGAKESISKDVDDMFASTDRLYGKSSLAFQGLQEITLKYGDAIATLDDKTKASIETIINQTGYTAGLDSTYRQLTAAIGRANSEMEVELKIKADLAAADTTRAAEKDKELEQLSNQVLATEKVNVSSTKYGELLSELMVKQANVNELRNQGIITEESAIEVNNRLKTAFDQYTTSVEKSSIVQAVQTNLIADYNEEMLRLEELKNLGKITDREFAIGKQEISEKLAEASTNTIEFAKATGELSAKQSDLNAKIYDSQNKVRALTAELKKGNFVGDEELTLKAKLIAEQAKLNDLKLEATRNSELENATYPELVAMQREYSNDLEILTQRFQAGLLTKAQYDAQSQQLIDTLNQLNGIINNNTDELEDNNDELERKLDLLGDLNDEQEKAKSYASLELANAQNLNKAYDFTNENLSTMTQRYKELAVDIANNNRVNTGWWANLAKTSNIIFKQEQAVISETIAIRKWTAEIEKGGLSLEQLEAKAKSADYYFKALSDNQMAPLLEALSKAKADFQDLTETIDTTLDDVQDRLDLALGNTAAITKRQFANEIDEMQSLIDRASAYGDSTLTDQLRKALSDLKKAQGLEYESEYGSKTAATTTTSTQSTSAATNTTPTQSSGGESVTLNLALDGKQFATSISKDVLSQLMIEIEKQKRVGN
ncbi:tape measure protein [Shewanella sp. phage 1/44]|uniref:tail length tape measure protein n=1 Tax=Shewanella sp. phage 1/44 TaxID=1458862 RepID=UPI0004F7148B|nr:tail length tape measure protein [Shewanella sp. phage 1/44]AHK11751.1 tape measure protein [Shewanella sp. phage 1/44]